MMNSVNGCFSDMPLGSDKESKSQNLKYVSTCSVRDGDHFLCLSFPSHSRISFFKNMVMPFSVCSENSFQGSPCYHLLVITDITTGVHLSHTKTTEILFPTKRPQTVIAFRLCWAYKHKGSIMPSSHFLPCTFLNQ